MVNRADTLFEKQLPIALGPMAGVTDLPFRFLCRSFGADMKVSLVNDGPVTILASLQVSRPLPV